MTPHDAQRMPGLHHPVVGALGGERQAVELARQADREVADVDHLLHFAQAFGGDLAGLERDQPAEVGLGRAQLFAEQAHQLAAARRRHVAPGLEGRMRAADGLRGFGRRGLRARRRWLAGDRASAPAGRRRCRQRAARPGAAAVDRLRWRRERGRWLRSWREVKPVRPVASRSRCSVALANPVGCLLGHHQGGAVGVAAGDGRHRAGIDHAQAVDAAHAQARSRAPPSGRRRRPSSWCRPDGRSWCAMSPARRASSSSLWYCTPGFHSSGAYFASAGWATMRRVTRSESAATLRSSAVLR